MPCAQEILPALQQAHIGDCKVLICFGQSGLRHFTARSSSLLGKKDSVKFRENGTVQSASASEGAIPAIHILQILRLSANIPSESAGISA